jgi:hypothetical protein
MINTSESRIIFNGNGTATEFPYSFAIINDTDVKVMTVDPDGVETVLDSDYYVDVTASKVIYPGYPPGEEPAESERPPVLPTGWQLVVYRDIPITQEANLGNVWPFNVIEDALDKITMILQNAWDNFNRCLKLSVSTPVDVDTTVPTPEPGKAFGWSSDGKKIINIDNPQEVYNQTVAIRNEVADMEDNVENIQSDVTDKWQQVADLAEEVEADRQETANNAYEANLAADRAEAMAAQVEVYDPLTTYEPGDVVMTPEGDTYRCIAESTGETPNSSNKWVLITQVKYETFELDVNGDLQPLYVPKTSTNFEIDENGDIMPIED